MVLWLLLSKTGFAAKLDLTRMTNSSFSTGLKN